MNDRMRADFQMIRQMMNEDLDKLERNMSQSFEKGNASLAALERDFASSERAVEMLTKQVEIAQRREKELLDENAKLNEQLARLNAKLQGIRDQVGGDVDEPPTYKMAIKLGEPHEAVNADIKKSAETLAGMDAILDGMEREMRGDQAPRPVQHARGLSRLLDTLRGPQDGPAMPPLPEFPESPRVVQA